MKILLITLLVFSSVSGFCQDIIVGKDGKTIKARVVEITQSEIKYKRYDNLNGPLISISKDGILIINYENGTKETFGRTEDQSVTPKAAVSSSTVPIPNDDADLKLGDVVIFRGDNGKFRTGRLLSINRDSAIVRSRYKTMSLPIGEISKKFE